MRVQVAWAAVVLLQVLGCCWAFGSYPGTFYQMMLRLNKERKYARTAPSPSRLWAIFNPAATLGSLSDVPFDSNRVVRRDLEPRQVQQPSTQRPTSPAEESRPLSGSSGLPGGESQPTSEAPEHTSGGSAPGSGATDPTESTTGVSASTGGGLEAESEPASGRPNAGLEATSARPVTGISEDTRGGSDAITEESETTSERPNSTEPTREVSETINGESDSASRGSNEGFSNATESETGDADTTTRGSEPVTEESNNINEGLEPTSISPGAVSGTGHEGAKEACGKEVVMPAPPASLSPTQGFTLKQNLSTPGWDEGRYPEDVECVWSLKVGPECEVGLLMYQVLQGEVLESPRCTGDYLEFLQPNSHATRYCGPLVNNRDKVSGIDSWHSSQERTTVIRFRSEIKRSLQDRSVSGTPRGFLMEVTYYCWLYNKEAAVSTRENEVSGDEGQQHDGGRTEGSAEETLENNIKENEQSEHDNSQDEALI
ncbi:hypothetical protein O3P69_009044 [Scylla paramamosain]|uniref:CUB domain-containing protein n=1 Tax=Scylla paramamosain TaxID=85552 RepID=A0AAW0TPX5_SCYPA